MIVGIVLLFLGPILAILRPVIHFAVIASLPGMILTFMGVSPRLVAGVQVVWTLILLIAALRTAYLKIRKLFGWMIPRRRAHVAATPASARRVRVSGPTSCPMPYKGII